MIRINKELIQEPKKTPFPEFWEWCLYQQSLQNREYQWINGFKNHLCISTDRSIS